jgi:hypothetical protein
MKYNLGFARRNAENSRKFFGSRHEAISKKCYLCVISGFRHEVDENSVLLYCSSHVLQICWQTTYNNQTRTRITYDYRRPGLSDRPVHTLQRYSAIGRRTAPASKSILCLARPCVFVFVSWLRFCTHYCIWVPATSYILLYYKLQHFVLLCPIWQVRWIVKVKKETERKDLETKITIIRTMTMSNSMDAYVWKLFPN